MVAFLLCCKISDPLVGPHCLTVKFNIHSLPSVNLFLGSQVKHLDISHDFSTCGKPFSVCDKLLLDVLKCAALENIDE